MTVQQCLHTLMMTWLGALEKHKKVTKQMIYGKLEPGHFHVQIPALLRVSRTVQWIREASHRNASFLGRAIEEAGLSTLFLATIAYWLRDRSKDSRKTEKFLEEQLMNAHTLAQWLPPSLGIVAPIIKSRARK